MVKNKKIPDGWTKKELRDIAPLQRGFDLPNKELKNGPYSVVYSNGISSHHINYKVKGPGVITGRSGTIGKVHYVEDNYWPHNTTLWVTDFKNSNPKFIYYLYSNLSLERFATGSGVPTLNRNDVHLFNALLPPIPEQQAIAEALSDIDNLITSLEKLIDKKQKIKQGTMQQLLTGKKRLPGFTGDWVIKKLGEIVNIRKGHQKNKDMLSNKGEYPVINGGIEPSGYTFDWNTEENTITISEGGNSCGYVNFIKTKFWSGGHCYTVQIKDDDLNNSFLYYLLKYYEIKIMALRVGSGLPNIQRKSIEEFEVTYIEGTQEQKAIAQILRDLDSEIEALEKKLIKYKTIKQGMMQELLTGRIRLV